MPPIFTSEFASWRLGAVEERARLCGGTLGVRLWGRGAQIPRRTARLLPLLRPVGYELVRGVLPGASLGFRAIPRS